TQQNEERAEQSVTHVSSLPAQPAVPAQMAMESDHWRGARMRRRKTIFLFFRGFYRPRTAAVEAEGGGFSAAQEGRPVKRIRLNPDKNGGSNERSARNEFAELGACGEPAGMLSTYARAFPAPLP